MILGENIGSVYSNGREIQRVYSLGKLVWEKEADDIDYSTIPFTVESLYENTKVQLNPKKHSSLNETPVLDFKYSINGGQWIETTTQTRITLNKNDKVQIIASDIESCTIRGETYYVYDTDDPSHYETKYGLSDISGNIMSLIYGDDFVGQTVWMERGIHYDGSGFFSNCHIRNAKNLILPATTLTVSCYDSMFAYCNSLTTAPKLPATTLKDYCYKDMFNGCNSLTTAPKLPATTLRVYCYYNMFFGCSSLTTAPELPAKTLRKYCYGSMFQDCTSLTTAPKLPATTLAESCFANMFSGCSSLTTVPKLPATTLAKSCCSYMFAYCSSLTTAPELPSTTLAEFCYERMFHQCTSLTTAPKLPATTLAKSCYERMFANCTSLTTAPALPATTLADSCYDNMFFGCSSLTTAPELPSTTLAYSCYERMFAYCTNLNYIKCKATSVASGYTINKCISGWTEYTSPTGTLLCYESFADDLKPYIPSTWTVQYI